ncbi:unnamed protein product, partial [Prorocentrum cordatum]
GRARSQIGSGSRPPEMAQPFGGHGGGLGAPSFGAPVAATSKASMPGPMVGGTVPMLLAPPPLLPAVGASVPQLLPGKEMCGDFRRGVCLRGDRCKYSHGQAANGAAAGGAATAALLSSLAGALAGALGPSAGGGGPSPSRPAGPGPLLPGLQLGGARPPSALGAAMQLQQMQLPRGVMPMLPLGQLAAPEPRQAGCWLFVRAVMRGGDCTEWRGDGRSELGTSGGDDWQQFWAEFAVGLGATAVHLEGSAGFPTAAVGARRGQM